MKNGLDDSVGVEISLIETVARDTGLLDQVVRSAWSWVCGAMLESRFNMYSEQGKMVDHVCLAVSVPEDRLAFSLEAHGFSPFPAEFPATQLVTAVLALLVDRARLSTVIEQLPTP